MADSIRIKRGVKADLPKALPLGELAYCTDTRQLFIGTGNSIAPVKAEEIHFDDLNERLEGNSQNINKLYKDVDELGSRVSNHNHDDRYYTESEINNTLTTYQKAYTDLSQLGLTTSNTIVDIITALPNKSTFTFAFSDSNNNTILGNQMPYAWGTLCIVKVDGSRTIIEFNTSYNNQKTAVTSKYYCNYNSSKKEISEWVMYGMSNNISNPNLLINGDFRINQRGQTTYTTTGKAIYTVDRWISYNLTDDTTEISVLNNGIKVKSTSRGNGRLRQTLEETDTKKLVGKTLTFSIKVLSDCSQCELITTKSRNVLGVSKTYTNVKAGDILSLTFDVTSDYAQLGVQFSSNDTNGISVAYAKLELGSVATPYQPKPYSQELLDCQRYYYRINTWQRQRVNTVYANSVDVYLPVSVPMRVTPTIASWHENFKKVRKLDATGGVVITDAVAYKGDYSSGFQLRLTANAHGYSDGLIEFDNTFALDAEIY